MRTSLAARWPRGARTEQAVGYLLAHHVPPARLAYDGLLKVREAAGWTDTVRDLDRAGIDPGLARSWVCQARDHARKLGPPPTSRTCSPSWVTG